MPIYTYICKDCGEKFDLLVGVTSEKPDLRCKKCKSDNISKVLSGFAVGGSRDRFSSGSSCSTGTCPTCY